MFYLIYFLEEYCIYGRDRMELSLIHIEQYIKSYYIYTIARQLLQLIFQIFRLSLQKAVTKKKVTEFTHPQELNLLSVPRLHSFSQLLSVKSHSGKTFH